MADQAQEPDWDRQYSESFTKKIPFPTLKYEAGKLNPAMDDVVYTIASANIHDNTNFRFYTSRETKLELEFFQAEARLNQPKPKVEEKKEEKKEGEEEVAPDPYAVVLKEEVYDPTEQAIIKLAEKREKERDEEKVTKSKSQEDAGKRKLSEDPHKEENKDANDDNKEDKKKESESGTQKLVFEELKIDKSYGENLKNCNKVITMWKVKNDGYRKIKEVYLFEPINTTMEFSKDGKVLLLTQNDSKTHIVYNALTLERIAKFELKCKDSNDYDVTYFYGSQLSFDGTYIIAGDSYSRYIFKTDGTFVRRCDGKNIYTIYQYSKTEFAGTKNSDETYTKTHLVAIDFLTDKETVVMEFDSYISTIYFNNDCTCFCYDKYPKLYYVNLKGDKTPKEIVKEYYSMNTMTFKGNKVAILYQPNYQTMWVSVFEDAKLLWKQTLDKTYVYSYGFQFLKSDNDALLLIEQENGSMRVNLFEKDLVTDYTIKAIRNITFQYPIIAYAWGTRELWVQDMSNNITIYYFDGSITGMENVSNVSTKKESKIRIGLVLDYYDYFSIADMECDIDDNELTIQKRKIMKNELPDGKVKSFYRIRMHNQETKQIEDAVIIHLKNIMVALSLESKSIKHEIKQKVSKYNVIYMKDAEAMFFWKDKGDKLEMLKLPFDPNSSKAIQKVYEADEDIRYARLTYIDGKEHIVLVDQPKFVKILKFDDNKLTLHKDYFVDTYFSSYSDVNSLKAYCYSNEMMYSNNGGYILQEKGKEKEGKFYALYYSQYSLDYSSTKFPMCSEDFVLYSLSPEWNSAYTEQKQFLMLAPPMNSYRIKQREIFEDKRCEFFLPFDDKYIVLSTYTLTDEDNSYEDYEYSVTLDIYQLNGEVVQTLTTPKQKRMYCPVFSQSGEFMLVPTVTNDNFDSKDDKFCMIVYRICPANDYKRLASNLNGDEIQRQQSNNSKDVAQLEVFKVYDIDNPKTDEEGQHGIFAKYFEDS